MNDIQRKSIRLYRKIAGTRLKLIGLRAEFFVLTAFLLADIFLVDHYERFAGDPLQVRGFSLAMQVRTWLAIGAVRVLFQQNLSLVSFLPFLIFATLVCFQNTAYLEPRPEETGYRNIRRFAVVFVLGRCMLYLITILLAARGSWLLVPVVFAALADACDPKPPRPRRVRALILVKEGPESGKARC